MCEKDGDDKDVCSFHMRVSLSLDLEHPPQLCKYPFSGGRRGRRGFVGITDGGNGG